MFEKISRKKITVVVIAGLLTVTCATTVFAADVPGHDRFGNQKQITQFDATKMTSAIKSAVQSLVNAGTITQAQADAINKVYTPGENAKQFHENKGNPLKSGKNPVEKLVTDGIITQAQADAIFEALKPEKNSGKTIKETLDKVVAAGTITQAQEDAIIKVFPARAERFTNRGERKGFWDNLVTEGTITQAQADSIISAVKDGRAGQSTIKEVLESLVSKSTITQAQAGVVQKACIPPERKNFEMKRRKSPLAELVTAGTITQAQADEVNSAVKSAFDSLKK